MTNPTKLIDNITTVQLIPLNSEQITVFAILINFKNLKNSNHEFVPKCPKYGADVKLDGEIRNGGYPFGL